jgi:hypothetical protein
MARHSLAVATLVSFKSPLGARLEATHDGGGSQPEERHGLAAEVRHDHLPLDKPATGVFWKNIPVPTIF